MSGEDKELGERTGTGKPQPTEEELAARRKKRGEHVTGGPEGKDGFGGGPEGGSDHGGGSSGGTGGNSGPGGDE